MDTNQPKEWKENLSREDVAEFLISLGNQIKKGDTLTVRTEEWGLPFTFRSPIELSVKHSPQDEELEIEVEFKKKKGNKGTIRIE